MYHVTDEQIDLILHDLTARGIRLEGLRQNLLDHICIIIEQELEGDGDFEAFYQTVIRRFYTSQLRELEDAAIFLAETRSRVILLRRPQFFIWLFVLVVAPFFAAGVFVRRYAGYYMPADIWAPALIYTSFLLLIFLVLLLTPDRFDPLIPKGSKVLLGWKPFISIIPPAPV